MTDAAGAAAVVLERVTSERGELVLRKVGEHFEIISNGVFLMDTRGGASERILVRAALDRCPVERPTVAIAGLGVGFSLVEACSEPRVAAITVVEVEPALVAWHRRHLRGPGTLALDDPRVRVVIDDVVRWCRRGDRAAAGGPYDVVCVDVDNGPHWRVTRSNAFLYGDEGTLALSTKLTRRGVLAVWSAASSADYEQTLRRHFREVSAESVVAPRGEPDVVYLATGPLSA